jgi:hypothetical protein
MIELFGQIFVATFLHRLQVASLVVAGICLRSASSTIRTAHVLIAIPCDLSWLLPYSRTNCRLDELLPFLVIRNGVAEATGDEPATIYSRGIQLLEALGATAGTGKLTKTLCDGLEMAVNDLPGQATVAVCESLLQQVTADRVSGRALDLLPRILVTVVGQGKVIISGKPDVSGETYKVSACVQRERVPPAQGLRS